MAVVYSQFALNQWKLSLTAAHVDKVKGTGMINSEAKLLALCFLASHVNKQVNILQGCLNGSFPQNFGGFIGGRGLPSSLLTPDTGVTYGYAIY